MLPFAECAEPQKETTFKGRQITERSVLDVGVDQNLEEEGGMCEKYKTEFRLNTSKSSWTLNLICQGVH